MMNRDEISGRNPEQDITARFWRSVDARLKEAGMPRAELGRRAGLSPQSLSSAKYLKTSINIFTALRIAEALGCTIEELIDDSYELPRSHRVKKYACLIAEVKEEAGSNGISKLAELFGKLTEDEQLAVLVHAFSILGISPKKTLEKIGTTDNKGDAV